MKKLSDRELLLEILWAQAEIARILFLMNVTQNSRTVAGELHTHLGKIITVKEI